MNTIPVSGNLRQTLEMGCAESGLNLGDLTVLSVNKDPFRLDTPANHVHGAWFAEQAERLNGRRIHLRGFHYALISAEVTKPNACAYRNIYGDWDWMQKFPAKCGRWLGYVDWERIYDARSRAPLIRPRTTLLAPDPYVHAAELDLHIPRAVEIDPYVGISGDFDREQPYRLVIFCEKSSLEDVVAPLAHSYGADLFLETGEISDSHLYLMAKAGAEDSRPMVVFTIADCDPSGWQMAVSVARKLQAFKTALFQELSFQVRRIALTPAQVMTYGLPSTPLSPDELRADDWKQRMGVEQTEIDALATLRPDLLRQLVQEALAPFFDATLSSRVAVAELEWHSEAWARIHEHIDRDELDRLRAAAQQRLEEVRAEIDSINDAITELCDIDIDDLDLPEIVVPEPELNGGPHDEPLVDSSWPWSKQSLRLKRDKEYAE